ncbi:MAG: GNAT family N-acetyltransferase, partial [Rubricoccaceae bacterium]|nr:GNAT family N-acetyltransferase [Rubricoccaceae bacterium]
EFDLEEPHVHLNMIGVRSDKQGLGLGRMLLNAVDELSDTDSHSIGVTLSTENEANIPLYEHAGYEVVGSKAVAAELKTWAFFRKKGGQ